MTLTETKNLLEAARKGDVDFLKKCVKSNNPNGYYLTWFPTQEPDNRKVNFLHEAAKEKQEDFIREAVINNILPTQILQQLLLQQSDQINNSNPLHVAAIVGNLEIVKLFLKPFQSPPNPITDIGDFTDLPWFQRNDRGRSPCAVAILEKNEDCALEILEMDIEKLANITDDYGSSLLYEAVVKGFDRFVWKILRSGFSFSFNGLKGYTSLHFVTNCTEGEDILRELLKRSEPNIIEQKTTKGRSILHTWAKAGKKWPFECLLKCNDIPNIKRIVVNLMHSDDCSDGNPLHFLANHAIDNEDEAVEIAQLLIDTCKQQALTESTSSIDLRDDHVPWLAKDMLGRTPLAVAVENGMEKLAMYMILVDKQVLKMDDGVMFLAIDKKCHKVGEMILEIVNEQGWTKLLTNHQRFNALHVAPKCKGELCKRLLKTHPEFIKKRNKDGMTILHEWVKIGEVWPFEYVLHDKEIDRKLRREFIDLIRITDENEKNNPLHIAATTTMTTTTTTTNNENVDKIAKLLVEAYREEYSIWRKTNRLYMLPWFSSNRDGDGPLHQAIRNKRENLALYILSLHPHISEILDIYYRPDVHKTLFLAMNNNCYQVAKEILMRLDKRSWTKYLTCTSDGRNVMHLAPACTDKDFGTWLVKEASEFITIADNNRHTPLEEASNMGKEWIIKAMLETDHSVINLVPLAWVKACENGHISAIKAFINNYSGNFKDHCVKHEDSPLHHIKLKNLTGYREFLKIPDIKDLINVQDSKGNTPLHQAILSDNKLLTEILLNVDDIDCYIKDDQGKTAIDLLAQVCQKQRDWRHMCKRSQLGFDPTKKLRYFPNKNKLLDARSILSTVAALLATITFAAGFTLPGGFDQNTGKAVLARNAAFIVFLLSDTLAMCCSMLILICVIMSIVFESSTALLLIDRSVKLLIVTFYCTLLAFMTGVFTVISSKSLWVAILIVVMCSLGVLMAHIILLPNVLAKLTPQSHRKPKDPTQLLEQGGVHSSRDSSSHDHTS